jgi:membrane protease YdiL (CAAX protease family)
MMMWMIAAVAAAYLAILLPAFVIGVHDGLHLPRWPMPDPGVLVLMTGIGMQSTLLFGAWRRARALAADNWTEALGFVPVRRYWLLCLLAVLLALYIGCLILAVVAWRMHLLSMHAALPRPGPDGSTLLAQFATAGVATRLLIVLLAVGVAPLAEECFFRGWLWTALRAHWGPFAVMLCTGLPWLALHLLDGLTRPLFLIPAAIALSLARHFCGSLRASVALHAFNNLLATGLVVAATL